MNRREGRYAGPRKTFPSGGRRSGRGRGKTAVDGSPVVLGRGAVWKRLLMMLGGRKSGAVNTIGLMDATARGKTFEVVVGIVGS